MAIEIAGWSRYENAQRRFTDTRARKIDSRIDEILVSFVAFAAGRKVEREEARERARLEEIARQRPPEQARLAKLEQQRVKYLDRKLAQAEERDRLGAFLTTLLVDQISEEASAFHAFIECARRRLEKVDAQFQLATLVPAKASFHPRSALIQLPLRPSSAAPERLIWEGTGVPENQHAWQTHIVNGFPIT